MASETAAISLQVIHHVVEGAGQFADFVLSLNIDFVVQVARGPDLLRDLHQLLSGSVMDLAVRKAMAMPRAKASQRAEQRDRNGRGGRRIVDLPALLDHLLVFLVSLVERFGRVLYPGRRVFLQIKNLKFCHGGVAVVHLLTFVHQGRGEIFGPALLRLLYFFERRLSAGRKWQGASRLAFCRSSRECHRSSVEFAGVAAQKVIAQVQAVLHHLEADVVGCVREFRAWPAADLALCSRCTAIRLTGIALRPSQGRLRS